MLGRQPALHWINDLRHNKVFHRLAQMTPSLVIQFGLHLVPELSKTAMIFLGNVALAFTILFLLLAVSALLNALLDIYARTEHARTRSIKGYVSDALGIPATRLRSKAKGAFLRSALDRSQIRTIFEGLTGGDYGWRGAAVVFVTWGGKINALSPEDTATAVAERDSVALFSVGNFWDDPDEDEKHLTWNRTLYRDVFAATGGVPVPNDRTGGCYINWPDPDLLDAEWNQSGVPWPELYYGANYRRLQEAKRRWDPHQVFDHVLSVRPARERV